MTKPPVIRRRALAHKVAAQRGATLIIGLIMMVLITLIVINAFTLSSSNLKSVGNMQVRQEAAAAADQAVETLVSTQFYNSLNTTTYSVDINKDGTPDYSVALAAPVCIGARQVSSAAPSDVELPVAMQTGADWSTDWEMDATVTDSVSGAMVRVREGVRVRMAQATKVTVCPQPANRSTP
jgi:FlaG/FlaF family flagellin (archaellin)